MASPSKDSGPSRSRLIFSTVLRRISPLAFSTRGRISLTTISTQLFLAVLASSTTLSGFTGRRSHFQPRSSRPMSSSLTAPWYLMW
jgi:hypothetical protein